MSYEDSIYSDESQASQLLKELARTPVRIFTNTAPSQHEDYLQEHGSLNASELSIRKYSYHGLVNSPARKGDNITQSGSQKENSLSGSWEPPGLQFNPSVIPQLSQRQKTPEEPVGSEARVENELSHRSRAGTQDSDESASIYEPRRFIIPVIPPKRPIPTKSASISNVLASSSGTGTLKSLPARSKFERTRRQRSPSPQSQDSFAGPISFEAQQKLDPVFHRPLFELGQSQSQTSSMATDGTHPSAYDDEVPERFQSRVFVAGTPSISDQSQNQSQSHSTQDFSFSQPIELSQSQIPYTNGQDQSADLGLEGDNSSIAFPVPSLPYPSSETSSCGPAIKDDDDSDDSQPVCIPTQIPGDYIQTQPSDMPSTGHSVGLPYATDYSQPEPSSYATDNPRSILSMGDSHNQWRMHGQQLAAQPTLPDDSMDTQVDNDFTQTQPSAASNLRATGLPVDGRPPSPPPSIARQQRHAPLRTRTIGSDLDVVPDSENADDAEPGPPSSPETISIPLGPPTPVKKAKYVRTPVARIASPEIVPDSFIEEEEEEEEEAPLAIATRKKTSLEVPKGKTRERSTISPVAQKKPSSRLAETAPPRTRKQSRSATKPPGSATSRREEAMEVVPSSLPLQDYPEPAAKSVRPYKKKKPMRTRAAPVTPVQSHSSPLSESSDAESVVIPDYVPEEAPIEPTPTEVSLDEEYEGATNATTSRKRKRIASTSKTKLNLRSASKVSKTPSITPDKRSAKRQKSTCSSRNLNNAPTRVFAVWKQDNHYYAGTVHSSCDSGRFKIHFDDETEDDVHINYIRRCELNEGDHVISNITKGKGKVVDGSRCAPDNVVIVEFDNGEELDQQELDLRDIKIANRSITSQWKDRMLNADDIVTIVKPKGVKLSPSSSKLSLNSSASSTRKLFMKTGFVVTLSILDENPDKKRNQLTKDLKSTSGEVFEDWSNIFDMPGTYSLSGKRWEITKGEVTFDKGDDLHRVFLLSDDANQKPKFLFALALGIPCIRTEWLSDSIHSLDEKEWSSYLLPAGTSMKLGARVSQAVDLDWCNSPHHLTEIMENPVPAKVFSGKHILCLSPDYLPVKAKKGDVSSTDKSAESSRQVPYIILAMGSSRVEAVAGPEHASLKIKDYDYVIVKEDDDVKKFSAKHRNANFVPFHWVKQCLIAGRLFPNSP